MRLILKVSRQIAISKKKRKAKSEKSTHYVIGQMDSGDLREIFFITATPKH